MKLPCERKGCYHISPKRSLPSPLHGDIKRGIPCCALGSISEYEYTDEKCLPSLFLSTSAAAPEAGTKGNSNGDWISFMLAFLLSHLPIPLIDVEAVDIPVWSRAISLGFTGLIILTSLAQVLRSLRRALKLTSKSVGAGFLLLTLGQLFVCPPFCAPEQQQERVRLIYRPHTSSPCSLSYELPYPKTTIS